MGTHSCFLFVLASSVLASAVASQVLGMPASFPTSAHGSVCGLRLADANLDGALDLIMVDFAGRVLCRLGNGDCGFGPEHATYGYAAFEPITSVNTVDVNRDGVLDVLYHLGVIGGGDLGIALATGNGDGTFTHVESFWHGAGQYAIGDLNGDGVMDLVGVIRNTSDHGPQYGITMGLASGGFGPFTPIPAATGQILAVDSACRLMHRNPILIGDVDRDGDQDILIWGVPYPDVAYAEAFSHIVHTVVMLNDGHGHFPIFRVRPHPADMLLDVDGDSFLDCLHIIDGHMQVSSNVGSPPSYWASSLAATEHPRGYRAQAADFNGDGIVDLAIPGGAASPWSPFRSVEVMLGDGLGGFVVAQEINVHEFEQIAVADIDSDGRMDVCLAGTGSVQILRSMLPAPQGMAAYGTGTPTCAGTMGMWSATRPEVGARGFQVVCSNAPPDTMGLLAIGTRHANGWGPAWLGISMHLGLCIPVSTARSDVGGSAAFPMPIPSLPWLAGSRVNCQAFWFGDPGRGNTCSPGLYELASSRGLTLTIQQR